MMLGQGSALHSQDDDGPAYRFPREQRDIELREVAEGFRLGVQTGANAYWERQEGTTERRSSI